DARRDLRGHALLRLPAVLVLRLGRAGVPAPDRDRSRDHRSGPVPPSGRSRTARGARPRVRSAPILAVDALSRRFGAVRAVDGASFEVEPGSITSLIGPNGAGKSTLFNVVSGLLSPDSGRVVFEGQRIDGRPPHRIARLGLVRTFQNARALTRLSVLDNLALAAPQQPGERLSTLLVAPGAARRHESETRARARALLELVRLDSHADALAATLSGGQRKLLDFARALMARPRLLLMDEPLAGVNPTLRLQLLDHIDAVRAEGGVTVVLVEHDLDAVMRVSDRVVVMSGGRVIAAGAPAEVRADAAVVDAYLGTDG